MKPASSAEIDALWVAMADIYGHRWVSSYGADARVGSGSTWAHGLAGVTSQQIAYGVSRCIAGVYAWPPTLGEFRALCLGVPTLASVRLDHAQSDPFTVLVWQFLDGYRYRQASADAADRMLREAYDLAREHVMRGGSLPEVAVALIENDAPAKYVEPSAEHKQDTLDRVRAELHVEPAEDEPMPLAEAETVHEQMAAAGSES